MSMRALLERAEKARDPWGDALFGLIDDVGSMESEISALKRKFPSDQTRKRLDVLMKLLASVREGIDASYTAGGEV